MEVILPIIVTALTTSLHNNVLSYLWSGGIVVFPNNNWYGGEVVLSEWLNMFEPSLLVII
jgi:hypothetical protein